jgi:hypothetical protein
MTTKTPKVTPASVPVSATESLWRVDAATFSTNRVGFAGVLAPLVDGARRRGGGGPAATAERAEGPSVSAVRAAGTEACDGVGWTGEGLGSWARG